MGMLADLLGVPGVTALAILVLGIWVMARPHHILVILSGFALGPGPRWTGPGDRDGAVRLWSVSVPQR
jgi:hypothetical protein